MLNDKNRLFSFKQNLNLQQNISFYLKLYFLIFLVVNTGIVNGASNELYVPKKISWEELNVIQGKVINSLKKDYKLSPQCFQDELSYYGLKSSITIQNILWNTYVWRTYEMVDGLNCLALINNYGEDSEKSQFLSLQESKILLSASEGIGFEEAGFYEFSELLNAHNKNFLINYYYDLNNGHMNLNSSQEKVLLSDNNFFSNKNTTTYKLPRLSMPPDMGVESNKSVYDVGHDLTLLYPYWNIVRGFSEFSSCDPFGFSGFLVSKNVTLTNGHNLYSYNCNFSYSSYQLMAPHNHGNSFLSHFPLMDAANMQISNNWINYPIKGNSDDYGVLRFNQSFIAR